MASPDHFDLVGSQRANLLIRAAGLATGPVQHLNAIQRR